MRTGSMGRAASLKQSIRSLISITVNGSPYTSAIDVASRTSCAEVTAVSGSINAVVSATSCANAATTEESTPPLNATTAPLALADRTLPCIKFLSCRVISASAGSFSERGYMRKRCLEAGFNR